MYAHVGLPGGTRRSDGQLKHWQSFAGYLTSDENVKLPNVFPSMGPPNIEAPPPSLHDLYR